MHLKRQGFLGFTGFAVLGTIPPSNWPPWHYPGIFHSAASALEVSERMKVTDDKPQREQGALQVKTSLLSAAIVAGLMVIVGAASLPAQSRPAASGGNS